MCAARALIAHRGAVVTPGGVIDDGHVVITDGRISAVGAGPAPSDLDAEEVLDAGGGWIAPGFIDLQLNGSGGIDVTTEPGRIAELAALLPREGVTAFVPTVITCSPERRHGALAAWAAGAPVAGTAAVPLGLHLEGPMLAAARRGAHPAELLAAPELELIEGWSRDAGVVLATIAPELPGAAAVIAELVRRGVVVALGHTDASAEQFAAGLAAGATYVTHLFNGMRPFGHRDPGPIGATLTDDAVVAGLICDGVHVDPIAVRLAWRALGPHRIDLVTDAVAARHAEGASTIGSVDVRAEGGEVRTADGVLAGSTLTLDQAVRNLVAFTGCAAADAVAAVTSTPAAVLGLTDRGALTPGHRGDVTILDADLGVAATIVGGAVAWR